jgi:hypothetical protein
MEAIVVAVVTAIPPSIAAGAAWRQSKKAATVAAGNGKGSIDKMLEKVLDHLETQDAKLSDISAEMAEHRAWVVNHRLDHLADR